ncbi:toxin [Hymenobacter ruricola]|uniref:Toxin n=1 Tax=Hymenobacter ruricola TaxID=2791023 RepID=A0ABS0I7Y7_9BACT|nr:toxin [Hymenobacter ruricola]MBF9223009.1 toxin [Hymenobacter ruricola]
MDTNAGGVSDGILIAPRPENRQALADLDITAQKRWQKIRDLKASDACQLLESDKPQEAAAGRTLWVFGVKVKKVEVYVKIQFGEHNDAPICISFHRALHKLIYLLS